MTKTASTHITFLIDRSGSMASQRQGVIDGFRDYVKEQQATEGDMTLLAIQFDSNDDHEIVVNGAIGSIAAEALADLYVPRGGTPLYDATAKAISATEKAIKKSKPDHVVVVVFTDGYENSSREFNLASLTQLVDKKESEGWTFVYLGKKGTHDVYAQASSYGTQVANTSNYASVGAGFRSVSHSTSSLRSGLNTNAVAGQTIGGFFTDEEGNAAKEAE